MIKKLLCLGLFLSLGFGMSAQTTYYVKSTGNDANDGLSEANAFLTIGAAYTAAATGTASTRDVINVIGTVAHGARITLNKHLDFVGMSSGTIDATTSTDGVFLPQNVTLNFTDLTFTESDKGSQGAVFLCWSGNNPTATFTNCTFSNNNALHHGGVFYTANGSFNLIGCTFTNNTTSHQGGAIFAGSDATYTISNSIFTSNTSDLVGGAIHHQANSTMTIINSTFDSNSSDTNGGAINLTNSTSTNLSISGSSFLTNTAVNGGGIYSSDAPMTITTSTFANNEGTSSGGGITIAGDGTSANSFTNVTFYGNTTDGEWAAFGGAVRINGNGARNNTFTNCLFNNNRANHAAASPLRESDVWGNEIQAVIFNNCILENWSGNSIDTGGTVENDVNNGSTFSEDLSESSLSFVSPNLTFSAPTSISNPSPIDFGNDGEDIGAWDSNINIFKGTTDSDWATASNWSGSVPTATDNVTLLSDSPALIIGASTGAVANDLSVDAATSLSITSGGSLILSGSSTGNITYNLSVADANWHTFASPVSGEQFDTTWADSNSIATGSGSNRGISWYNNGTPDGTTGYWRYYIGGTATTFGQGVGYSLKSTGATTYAYTGSYSSGDLTPAISMGAGTNWNLLGNSFSSYVDIATFLTNNSANINASFNAVYVWNGSSYQMLTTGKLHPGQAFFINSQVNGTATIASSLQSHDTGTSLLKSASTPSINLMISDDLDNYSTEINYLDGKTKGLDSRYDLGMFTGVSSKLNIFTQLVKEDNGIAFARQALPNSGLEDIVVPVGVKATEGKEITISAEVLNIPSELKVYLEDRENNTFLDLSDGNKFKTTLTTNLNGIGRFYLHTRASVLSTESTELNDINIYKTNQSTLRIAGLHQGKATIKLFNILGKQVLNTYFTSNGVSDVNLPSLAKGIYIVQLSTENGMLNKKITLE